MTADLPSSGDASDSIVAEANLSLAQLAKTDAPFPIVGMAASAGGLEAFTELIRHLPIDTGMAFVLIQHLSPDHESLLSEILSRVTAMPVHQVQDRMMVEPNEIYVIPPNSQMTLLNGMLYLAPRQKSDGKYLPGDVFFESLATDRGTKAIAVVLSGTDGDGSHGLKAIKVAGGVTFAQCESTAKFDSMPNMAVATGNVDFVLPPQAIAAELVKLSRSRFLVASEPPQLVKDLPPKQGHALTTIFALLRTTTGVDFTLYKPTTLDRRMQRRMLLYKLESLEEYAQYLQDHPPEVQALYEEILIHVTRFFRDPEIFEQLKVQVFPTISQNKASDKPIRIWVAGCSTGEEVYSIAIALLEFFSDRATMPPIQIFATDISETAISKARSGFYLENQLEGVSLERRTQFFIAVPNGGYQVSSVVRELCIFARHNLGGDPPFSNLDLISCRNLLIYLSDPLQEHIMSLFHYSLNLTGFLLLGTSESIKNSSDLFTAVDEACKLYTRKLTLTRPLFSFTTSPQFVSHVDSRQRLPEAPAIAFDLEREVDQLISSRYAPVSVVIDDQMHIVEMRGDLDPYLKLPAGTTELNLLLMARGESLAIALRTVIYQAHTQNAPVRQEQVEVEVNEQTIRLNLEVIPFRAAVSNTLYFLVFFGTVSSLTTALNPATLESLESVELEREIINLRQALAAATQRELSAQAHLQAVIQEHNHLTQNLRVANEEILSSNEELQSTNEELQTAKEEIQATNEELSTTNDELRSRNLQQNRDNSDLNNFIASINIPIVMLTNELRIRRFTPTAQRLFNFIPTDVGRPFSDLNANFDVSQLEPRILEVLETLNTQEQEIQTQTGYWYSLRIRPYRTTENQIDGVTLVFVDIDALKRHAVALEAARTYAETIIETVQTPIVVLDADLRVKTANRSFYETFRVFEAETERSILFELGNGQWNIPQLRSVLEQILTNDHQVQDFEISHDFEQIGQKTMLLNACKLQQEDNANMILLLIEDITERKQTERLLAQINAELEHQVQERTAQLQQSLAFEAGLKRITDKVRDSLDERQILQAAVQELTLVLGLVCCDTALYDLNTGTSTIQYKFTNFEMEGMASSPSAQGEVVSMDQLPESYRQLLQGEYFQFCQLNVDSARHRAILAHPLSDNQGVLGDLWLFKPKEEAFNELELRLVKQVANQCAIAIRQARLFQESQAQIEVLQKLDQLKDNFLSTTSHELRSPVANMRMAIRMVKISLTQERSAATNVTRTEKMNVTDRYLQILNTECEREINLINNLLDLQRLESEEHPLTLEPIQLQDWLPQVVAPFHERARDRQQTLQINLPNSLPSLNSDVITLERILAELLNNACKYTPHNGEIIITVLPQEDWIQIQISNTSEEISANELTHLFDKFYRIPNSDPWKQGGTGLGLALAQKLLESLNGTITAEWLSGKLHLTVQLPIFNSQP